MFRAKDEDVHVLLPRFVALVEQARPLPLAEEQVMIERRPLRRTLDGMRAGLVRDGNAAALDLLDAMDELVRAARPVPLTGKLRVDREKMSALAERLRATLD